MDAMRYGRMSVWTDRETLSFSTASSSIATRTPRRGRSGSTTSHTQGIDRTAWVVSMRKSGRRTTDRSRPVITSTIGTMINSTTTRTTSKTCPERITSSCTERSRRVRASVPISNRSDISPARGINQTRQSIYTGAMGTSHGTRSRLSSTRAINAASASLPSQSVIRRDSAPTPVGQHGGARRVLITRIERAPIAAKHSGSTSTTVNKRAHAFAGRNWRTRNDKHVERPSGGHSVTTPYGGLL